MGGGGMGMGGGGGGFQVVDDQLILGTKAATNAQPQDQPEPVVQETKEVEVPEVIKK